ncbi:hypothetical protein SAMN06295967_102148 [Belliella buryatensis]|uniref:Lipoprotein n=1 Tax=Belliella buryatensis TaxID=1500549 RepID=A0A239B5U0_9BACT|nr:hypothetical protein [Belliella buryatensis]SNS03267.1 hypothetical protein SAMN06295967_102148 [Belliella buryatensis]
MKLINSLVVVALLLISCNRSDDSTIGLQEVEFSVREYFINTEDKLSQFYYFNQVKNDSLFVFNVFSHSLEIIDIKMKERLSPIKFEFNGLNAVNGIRSFYYHNKDSIFFSEDNLSIALLSSEGELIDRYSNLENSLSFLDSEKVYRNMPSMEFSSQLLYNSINKEIIIYHQTFNQKDKKSIFSKYSIKSRKSKILPTYYPEEYLNQRLDLNKLFLTSAILNQGYLVYIFFRKSKNY